MKVFTTGTWDLFHPGHIEFLRRCRKMDPGVVLHVGVNSDDFAEELKLRRPVMREDERVATVAACRWADRTWLITSKQQLRRIITRLDPDLIPLEVEWSEKEWLKELGVPEMFDGRLVYLPRTASVSSSEIVERCQNQSQS